MALKDQILDDVKAAMRAGEKSRLVTLRMLTAAIKQHEVDSRTEAEDADTLRIVEKLVKQRREAAEQFRKAGRTELADKEVAEADILKAYLPEPLDDAALDALIDEVIAATGAASPRDMGKVMNAIRAQAQGRADMGAVSKRVKARLAG
ncbi:MAG: GatB/YqeY domain-containing protein [Chromatiales bacterium]|nr:MAG: GatB/YqeY domain-containing protein [Chromatiales bacterium]